MKTEDFDDAIKRKLESINPVFNEKDIERVHQYTIRNRGPLSVLRSSRFLWAVMGAGMLVTGLLTWKFTSIYDHKLGTVQRVVIQPSKQDIQKPATPKIITKTDTVFITKYVNKYPVSYSANSRQKLVVLASNNTNNTPDSRSKNNYKTAGSYLSPPSDILNGNSGNNTTNRDLTPTLSNNNTEKSGSSLTMKAAVPGNQKDNAAALNSPASNNPVAKPAETLAEKKDATSSIAKKMPVHNYNEDHKKTTVANPGFNLNVMAGIGGELANTQYGFGAFIKLIANNRFSLNTGIKEMNINHQYYGEDETYQQATGYDFKWKYAPDLSPTCDVTNIRFEYALWQIPLSLEYDFQLRNNWAISVSAGTDFDISCTQNLEFVSTENYGPIDGQQQPHNQVNNYSPVVFNNIVGSVGVLKQWHHLGVQLSPFASKQVATVWYKGNNNLFYGGNLKLFYCF